MAFFLFFLWTYNDSYNYIIDNSNLYLVNNIIFFYNNIVNLPELEEYNFSKYNKVFLFIVN